MSYEMFILNKEVFISTLREKKISQVAVANYLGISTKTVQRWVNGQSDVIRSDLLIKLAQLMTTDEKTLIRDSESLKILPRNSVLEQVLADEYYQLVLTSGMWETYLNILKGFKKSDLPTLQELPYHKRLGISQLFLRMFKSAKENFEIAASLALRSQQAEEVVEIFFWRSFLAIFHGELDKALKYAQESQAHVSPETSLITHRFYIFALAKVNLHQGHLDEAAKLFRKNISLLYSCHRSHYIIVSLSYAHLGLVYLRQRDTVKAKISFQRLLKSAKCAGWVQGQSIAWYGLGAVHSLQGRCDSAVSCFGKANSFKNITPVGMMDSCFGPVEFFYKVVTKDYRGANDLNKIRLDFVKQSRMQSSYVVLDMLFLSLLDEESPVAEELLKEAALLFKENSMHLQINTMETLMSKNKISPSEFLSLYTF